MVRCHKFYHCVIGAVHHVVHLLLLLINLCHLVCNRGHLVLQILKTFLCIPDPVHGEAHILNILWHHGH